MLAWIQPFDAEAKHLLGGLLLLCRYELGLPRGGFVTRTKAQGVVRWFASCGERYVAAYLGHVDAQRLAVDRHYGLKLFFFTWAFERAGAPRAYRIAAVKAVSSLNGTQGGLPTRFKEFCGGKQNAQANPAIDPRIVDVDVPRIVELVKEGELRDAFQKLALRGVGPKLRAFFLRDVVTLLNTEEKLANDPEVYLWCQPIDVWVRFAAKELCGTETAPRARRALAKYPLKGADLTAARGMVQLSVEAGVSPFIVNQGIWYFSANAVADVGRLRALVRSGDDRKLEAELALMRGFLPTRPSWG